MNELLRCKECGSPTVRVVDDVCENCGHRDRWIQTPLHAFALLTLVTIITVGFLTW
jgi:NMD protein affecting ribosome stability and mRNA decay